MSLQHKHSSQRLAVLSVADENVRRYWLEALIIGAFFLGYYYFMEVWPALLPSGTG